MRQRSGAGVMAFFRSLTLLGGLVVAVPWLLVVAAQARFGGGSPLHGVPPPAEWSGDRIWSALTDRLTDRTVADVVIRSSLVVAWVAVIVLVLTVVVELVHMVRHDGLSMPDVRGLGWSQSAARVIATGLLVVVPVVGSTSKTIARDGVGLVAAPRAAPAATPIERALDGGGESPSRTGDEASTVRSVAPVDPAPPADGDPRVSVLAGEPAEYVVRAGDSVYGIAQRIAGPEPSAVAAYADRLLELNLGAPMGDGQRFTNAAYIDVGWVLRLPSADVGDGGAGAVAQPDRHVVERGESLWTIADDELGDAERWPEIFEINRGRTFDDGRSFDDADLIQPGWELELPAAGDVGEPAPSPKPADDAAAEVPVEDATPVPGDDVAVPGDAAPEPDDTDAVVPTDADPVPVNVWVPKGRSTEAPATVDVVGTADPVRAADDPRSGSTDDRTGTAASAPQLLTYGRAAMLSTGVLTLLAIRRRNQLRQARPRARLAEPPAAVASTERTLRTIDAGERLERVEAAIRAAAPSLVESGVRLLAVSVAADGELELRATGPARLAPPWTGADAVWSLSAATPIELLAEAGAPGGFPCPALVQLGRDEADRDVYVDLEAVEAVEVGGPGDHAVAVVAAIAATLAGSVLAEVTTLVGLGVPDDAFLGHRRHEAAHDTRHAFEVAADALGSTATQSRSTFDLRATATASGETWEPAVVLAGSAAGVVTIPSNRTGLAVVSASPIHGPSSRLAPDGDAWELRPAGIRVVPIGLRAEDVADIAALVDVPSADEPPADEPPSEEASSDEPLRSPAPPTGSPFDDVDDLTIVPPTDEPLPVEPEWALLVRLLGPVAVTAANGEAVSFERSKTRELVAWLATHRERSTRSAARTALWELDVRDATFANVVSEARRALARLVEPAEGDEWVGRTMTDDLPLHELVRTDADLLRHALDTALLEPPDRAIAILTPAVERIAGLPFEGTSYLWPDAEGLTSQLVLLATSAAAELAAHCLSLGDVDGVFAATGRGLRVLPGHEELIGLRMRAHARAGDHAGVRQEWESYERVINADPWSDGEPSPKLVELRRQLVNPPT